MTVTAVYTAADVPVQRSTRRPVVSEVIVIVFLLRVYDIVRQHAEIRRDVALGHGHGVLHLEQALHLDPEHWLNALVSRHAHLSTFVVDWYQYLHIPVTMTMLGLVWLLRPAHYRPLRTALVLLNLVALSVFLLWPLAPPRLLADAGFVDSSARAGFGEVAGASTVSVDQFGAMPSLHMAWAVWCAAAVVLVSRHPALRRVRHVAWLYPATTAFVVVATANHYVADVVAGLAVATGALVLALRCEGHAVGWSPRGGAASLLTVRRPPA